MWTEAEISVMISVPDLVTGRRTRDNDAHVRLNHPTPEASASGVPSFSVMGAV